MNDGAFSGSSPACAQCWFSALSVPSSLCFSLSSWSRIICLCHSESKYHFFQEVLSNPNCSLIVRIPFFGRLLFIPVFSVSTFGLGVKLLLSWKGLLECSCLLLTSLWNMLSKCIHEGNQCNSELLVNRSVHVSDCPGQTEAELTYLGILNGLLKGGSFYFHKVSFSPKDIPLVCYKAWVAKISMAHPVRREWSKNWEVGGWVVRGLMSLFFFWVSFAHLIPPLPLFGWPGFPFQSKSVEFRPPVSIFLSLCHLLALPSLRENSDTLTCINRSWEIAKLFFVKYVFLGSARPQMCSKAADIGFPLSHSGRKYVILSLPLHVSCPQGTQWHN